MFHMLRILAHEELSKVSRIKTLFLLMYNAQNLSYIAYSNQVYKKYTGIREKSNTFCAADAAF
jgi:hypothetical protein